MINKNTITQLTKVLDGKDISRLKQTAEEATEIERVHNQKMDKRYKEIEKKLENALLKGKPMPKNFSFDDIITENAFDTAAQSFKTAEKQEPKQVKVNRLAKKTVKKRKIAKGRMPKTLSSLMEQWDKWRKGEISTPKRQKELAESLKKAYLDKTQEAFKRYSREFREGSSGEKREIVRKIKVAGRTTYSRAKTIVETETTKYYNQARRDFYDASDDVAGYLFVPVRDMATTKWCNDRRMLVYMKDSKYLDKETPPIHWNCRSELLPLTPLNPKHKKLIDDKSRRRENQKPAPLPKAWKG